MITDNIFKLVNKFSSQEDQLSAAFGFMLRNNSEIMSVFLKTVGVDAHRKLIKEVDVETQVAYDSGKSRIDLQIIVPDSFLIFCESKITSIKHRAIYQQLRKYREILYSKKSEFNRGVKLIYIGKYRIGAKEIEQLRKDLRLTEAEFYFFCWEDLIKITSSKRKKELVKLFHDYIGDSMHNKKIIEEQKLKNVAEVMVVFTKPEFWKMTLQKNIAVQKNNTPDTQYIAFLRTHLPNKERSKITHIAKVEYTENDVPRSKMLEGLSKELVRKFNLHAKSRPYSFDEGTHKVYTLKKGSITELLHPIEHDAQGLIVKFRTTLSELLKSKTTKEMKKGKKAI